jgi:Zn-dependent protease
MHRTGWFLVLLCLFAGFLLAGWRLGLPVGGLLLASLLLHEAGHRFAAENLSVRVYECGIKLGGTYIKRACAFRRRDEILIAISGPAVNLLMVIPLLSVPRLGAQVAMCNLVIGVVNLIPLPSSDGLRVLRNLSGSMRATGQMFVSK